jgi:hypothetical protein
MRLILCFLACAAALPAGSWENLFNGKNLQGWQVRGEGIWTVLKDGALLGQRRHENLARPFPQWPVDQKQYASWLNRQAWLYTERDFGEFDLHLEYLIPPRGNSGISIRDVSRAYYVTDLPPGTPAPPPTKGKGSPAHVGYEIQIIDGEAQKFPTGSIYLFAPARTGLQKTADWNSLDVESRQEIIRVKVNGAVVAEHAGDPERSKTGPIGLQLHDQFTFVMFRNIRIRELKH